MTDREMLAALADALENLFHDAETGGTTRLTPLRALAAAARRRLAELDVEAAARTAARELRLLLDNNVGTVTAAGIRLVLEPLEAALAAHDAATREEETP